MPAKEPPTITIVLSNRTPLCCCYTILEPDVQLAAFPNNDLRIHKDIISREDCQEILQWQNKEPRLTRAQITLEAISKMFSIVILIPVAFQTGRMPKASLREIDSAGDSESLDKDCAKQRHLTIQTLRSAQGDNTRDF